MVALNRTITTAAAGRAFTRGVFIRVGLIEGDATAGGGQCVVFGAPAPPG